MLARWRHRVLAVIAAGLGALCWLAVVDWLRPASGAEGLILSQSRLGIAGGTLLLVAGSIPAAVLSLVISAMGYSMTGLMVFSGGLIVVAAVGGPMDGWLRSMSDHAGYGALIGELVIWQLLLAGVILLIAKWRRPLHDRLPGIIIRRDVRSNPLLKFSDINTLAAGGLCAAIAGVILIYLLRSPDGGQVIWSLLFSFALASFIARIIFHGDSVIGILFSPAIVALASYLYAMALIKDPDHVQWLLNREQFPGPALALPIHYTSAAVTGCALGIGWAGNSEPNTIKQENKGSRSPEVDKQS